MLKANAYQTEEYYWECPHCGAGNEEDSEPIEEEIQCKECDKVVLVTAQH